jgi:hypothetical protein
MTRILPPVTRPWAQAINRRHKPPKAKHTAYRSCLRWEFGFSCAFCLLHEADIIASGVERWGVTHIEHFILQSRDPGRAKDYDNCFYICRLCNIQRRAMENQIDGGPSLLNPCDHAWGDRFRVVSDKILPIGERDADESAAYTCKAYGFNDPAKVKIREIRRRLIRQNLLFLEAPPRDYEKLLDLAQAEGNPALVVLAKKANSLRRFARTVLHRFRAIPSDHDVICNCNETAQRILPKVLEDQIFPMS